MKPELRPANPPSHVPEALLNAQHDTEAEHKHLQEPFTLSVINRLQFYST